MSWALTYNDSSNKTDWSRLYETVNQTVLKPQLQENYMPDVRNMTLRDALYLLESKLKVLRKEKEKCCTGYCPGANITKTQTVTLLLNMKKLSDILYKVHITASLGQPILHIN